jgi:hypothetical protein
LPSGSSRRDPQPKSPWSFAPAAPSPATAAFVRAAVAAVAGARFASVS